MKSSTPPGRFWQRSIDVTPTGDPVHPRLIGCTRVYRGRTTDQSRVYASAYIRPHPHRIAPATIVHNLWEQQS